MNMNDKINQLIKNLHRNNMAGYFVENQHQLFQLLDTLLEKGEKIGCGDSVTLEETGVFTFLRNGAYEFYDKHKDGLAAEAVLHPYYMGLNK